ncbi:DUF916 and DUF3324 domain-containing protein [Lacticaseibacillus sp. N501-2]|uniref:DUF916 and DUF3324 domain-containing protein n=1 Tax=Lacticaseibacillus salsurae TaxID=3367729 RepID=UPI0038B40926
MFKRLLLMAALVAGVAGGGHAVHAAEVNFQVAPEIPSNQIDKKLQYYDLLVTPGTTQNLTFLIQNTDSGSHKFAVSVNRAGTSPDGNTSYSEHGAKPTKSLKVNIESLFPKPHTYTVDPHSTRRISLKLTAPKTAWSGILLGALNVQKVDQDAGSGGAVGITSRPGYAIGIQLQATKTLPTYTPQLQFNGAEVSTNASGSNVSALLENPAPMLQQGLHVSAKVFHKNKQVLHHELAGIKLAPNAQMAFPLTTKPQALKAGTYHLVVTAQNGKQNWHFEDDFTVVNPVMKTQTTKTQTAHTGPFPAWVVAVMIAIASALGWYVWYLRSHRHE